MLGELLGRRVPQFVGLYVAGSWGFVEFVDWAAEQEMARRSAHASLPGTLVKDLRVPPQISMVM